MLRKQRWIDVMEADLINPFIHATRELMEFMVGIEDFKRTFLTADRQLTTPYDISAVININGDLYGTLVLSFTTEIAIKMLSQIMGETIEQMDNEAEDVVGEMINIIAGNAIKLQKRKGIEKMDRTVPNVVSGMGHKVRIPRNLPCINIGYSTELGDFAMQVSIQSAE
jgi:CheY-specific phosphatase CheX